MWKCGRECESILSTSIDRVNARMMCGSSITVIGQGGEICKVLSLSTVVDAVTLMSMTRT